MGIAEKALLASLKAQRAAVQAQTGPSNALDDETRAAMQMNLDYLDGQIAVLQGGGKLADLAHVPQPAGWGDDDPAVSLAAPDAAETPLVIVDPAGTTSAPRLGWAAKVGIAASILGAVILAVWLLTGYTDSGCDIWTSGEGWTHYDAGHPACDDP